MHNGELVGKRLKEFVHLLLDFGDGVGKEGYGKFGRANRLPTNTEAIGDLDGLEDGGPIGVCRFGPQGWQGALILLWWKRGNASWLC